MGKKVRTYRLNARKDYLALVKQRRPGNKKRRKAVGQQLRYLRRNLGHIEAMLDILPGQKIPLYPVHVRTRNPLGDMIRKLSDTSSHKPPQFLGTSSFKKPSIVVQNSLNVA